jgi:hypothetical protein
MARPDEQTCPYHSVKSIGELRSSDMYQVLSPGQLIERLKASPTPFILLHPLCGGMPIDLAWESLRLFDKEVLPAI